MQLDDIFEQLKILRDPEKGCPWDRKQTFTTCIKSIREEAEELSEALESGDLKHVEEEAGDLLWNVCFVIALAEENGTFSRESVIKRVVDKIQGRHPHVFGNVVANTPEEALAAFKAAKAKEKGRAD